MNGDLIDGLEEIVGHFRRDDAVVLIEGMFGDGLPYPIGVGLQFAAGTFADEVQVAGKTAAGLHVDVHAAEVRLDQGDQARKCRLSSVGPLAVDDLVNSHQGMFVFDWAHWRGGTYGSIEPSRWSTIGRRAVGAPVPSRGHDIGTKVKFFMQNGVPFVCSLHVCSGEGNRQVEV